MQLYEEDALERRYIYHYGPKAASLWYHFTTKMYVRDVLKDPRVKNTTSLLKNAPTLHVPQAMCAEKFTQAESNNPGTQIWICGRIQSNTLTKSTPTPTSIDISSLETIMLSLFQSTTSTTPTKLSQWNTSISIQQACVNMALNLLLLVENISLLILYSNHVDSCEGSVNCSGRKG